MFMVSLLLRIDWPLMHESTEADTQLAFLAVVIEKNLKRFLENNTLMLIDEIQTRLFIEHQKRLLFNV